MQEERDFLSDNEKPEDIIDEIDNILDGLHTDLTKDAIEVGQARDRFRAIKPLWEKLGNASTNDPDAAQIYQSGTLALAAIRDDYKSIARNYSPLHGSMGTILPSSDSAESLTNSTASFVISKTISVDDRDNVKIMPIKVTQRDRTRESLKQLSSELADTYDAIWEVLYGTRSNPERGSLYLIRQVFDHLFSVLTPDDKVIASQFWHPKAENEPHQVTRSERIEYAAYTHVGNQAVAKRLMASTKHMLDVYNALNKAHKRGKIDRSQARGSLKKMQAIIDDWVQSLSLGK